MSTKDALRSALKPGLDLLDRRVYNLARLIDAKTEELKAPLAAASAASAAAADAAAAAVDAVAAAAAKNGSSTEPLVAGLGHVRQDLAGIDQRLTHQVHGLARTTLSTQESYLESLGYVGRALREIRDEIAASPVDIETMSSRITAAVNQLVSDVAALATRDSVHAEIEAVQTGLTALRAEVRNGQAEMHAQLAAVRDAVAPLGLPVTDVPVSQLDAPRARFANYVQSHRGFAAQAGFWINQPVQVAHAVGDVYVDNVNERIVEIPFVFASLSGLPAGSRVLDVGGLESSIALSLASLGHRVTVVDPRGYPFVHPLLTVVRAPVATFESEAGSFDAIVCLSTIEHVGLPAYGGEPGDGHADLEAMRRLRALARPNAILALTVPFGTAAVDDFQRTYDRAALDALLTSWHVSSVAIAVQQSPTVWQIDDGPAGTDQRGVALVVARAV